MVGLSGLAGRESLFGTLPPKLVFRIERTEWAEIEVDVAGLIEEWKDDDTTPWDKDDVVEVLHKIGYADLAFSGDFIEVLDKDTEESISG